MITACGNELELSDEEARLWFDGLSAFLAPLNYSLYYHDAHTWLIQNDQLPHITAKPIYTLSHQSLMPELKNLDETLFWQQFITETQMFLSAHSLNKARKTLYPINGVWIWGGGPVGEPATIPLICNEPNLIQLGKLLSTEVQQGTWDPKHAKHSILILNKLNTTDRLLLEQKLASYTVCWYWNNMAYLKKPKRWWSRMIGKI